MCAAERLNANINYAYLCYADCKSSFYRFGVQILPWLFSTRKSCTWTETMHLNSQFANVLLDRQRILAQRMPLVLISIIVHNAVSIVRPVIISGNPKSGNLEIPPNNPQFSRVKVIITSCNEDGDIIHATLRHRESCAYTAWISSRRKLDVLLIFLVAPA